MDVIARMEKTIDTEHDPIKRWAMRKVLKNTIKNLEESK
jgi:hypothetical protein